MHVHEWPAQDQPKQKLKTHGPDKLTESELLSILLRTGNKAYNPVDLAKRILTQHFHIQELSRKSYQELLQIPVITESKEDKYITSRLVQTGKIMDIPVLDHVIIGDGKYFSFREEG